jgi:hypothetical protein
MPLLWFMATILGVITLHYFAGVFIEPRQLSFLELPRWALNPRSPE